MSDLPMSASLVISAEPIQEIHETTLSPNQVSAFRSLDGIVLPPSQQDMYHRMAIDESRVEILPLPSAEDLQVEARIMDPRPPADEVESTGLQTARDFSSDLHTAREFEVFNASAPVEESTVKTATAELKKHLPALTRRAPTKDFESKIDIVEVPDNEVLNVDAEGSSMSARDLPPRPNGRRRSLTDGRRLSMDSNTSREGRRHSIENGRRRSLAEAIGLGGSFKAGRRMSEAGRRMSHALVNAVKGMVRMGSSKRMLVPRTRAGRLAGRAVGNEVQAFLMMVPGGPGDSINREQFKTLLNHDLKRLKLSINTDTRKHIIRAVFKQKQVLDLDDFDQLLRDISLPVGALSRRGQEAPKLTRAESENPLALSRSFSNELESGSELKQWFLKRLKAYWDDNGRNFCLTIYALVNVILVLFVVASRNGWLAGYDRKRVGALGGWLVDGARSFGMLCNFNCAFVIVPMMRNHLTWLQTNTWLANYVPFDMAYDFHQLVGFMAFAFGSVHGMFHVVNLILWDGWSFQGNLWCGKQSDDFLLCSAISGIFVQLVFGIIVCFSLARFRKAGHFNLFWSTHHLVLLFYIILLLHGRVFWKWFLGPCLLYVLDRFNRARNASFNAEVVSTSYKGDGVLQIVFTKPWNMKYLPGQYVWLTAPIISKFEQHPFTLSSCPEDDTLECHIKTVGDWTEAAYIAYNPADMQDGKPAYMHPSMNLNVAGPYGSPSQDFLLHETAVLICAGIGVTPFASVIKHIHQRHQQRKALLAAGLKVPQYLDLRVKKLYFYWVCRTQDSLSWFTDVIRAAQEDMGDALDVNVYLSSMTALGDISAGMAHVGLHSYFHVHKRDALTQLPVLTHYHRPNWPSIFQSLQRRHSNEKVGVFFCGPHSLGSDLARECAQASSGSSTTFAFAKENF